MCIRTGSLGVQAVCETRSCLCGAFRANQSEFRARKTFLALEEGNLAIERTSRRSGVDVDSKKGI
jgi:hypothetical protein